jgi:hypothetical protein
MEQLDKVIEEIRELMLRSATGIGQHEEVG